MSELRRVLTALVVVSLVVIAGCGDDGDEASSTAPASSTSTSLAVTTTDAGAATTTPAPATTALGPTTTVAAPTTTAPAPRAATAIIEPDTIAGIPIGSNKSEAIAVLGEPTTSGQETDLSGATYDYLRWQFAGNRGLFLNFRTQGATSPLLTDWIATAPGPATARGIKVGDPESAVVAAYGPLSPFCCGAVIADVSRGPGRMIVVVEPGGNVRQIIGGDPGFWSRSIAD